MTERRAPTPAGCRCVDIQAPHLAELYGVQRGSSGPLEDVYPIVFLDCLVIQGP